jgi:hypothetical protein
MHAAYIGQLLERRSCCTQLRSLPAVAAAVQFCAYDWRVMELAVALSK